MIAASLSDRIALAERIEAVRQSVAEAVTEEFFARHPDWLQRYGERGRRFGIEDALFHQSYLASAIESGSVEPFEAYARWTTGVLQSRGIAPQFVAENLRQIGEALRPLLSAEQAAIVAEYIEAAARATGRTHGAIASDATPTADPALAESRAAYLQAALRGDRRAATTVAVEAVRRVSDVVDVYVEIFQQAQYEVGRLWEANRITVAEEHMATAITQYVMAQVYREIRPAPATAGRLVITGIEGELHQVGPNMVADVFEIRGWDVRFLGSNMPHGGILGAIDAYTPDVVGISATMLFSLPKAIRLIEVIRDRFAPSPPRIIVGGRAFLASPALCEELGTNAPVADLRAALTLI